MISDLKKRYPEKIIGYSDHTVPGDMKNLEIAALLGAVILEKHFTHDKTLSGNDHYHAMDKDDLKLFRNNFKRNLEIIGKFDVTCLDSEVPARNNARRSLVAAKDIAKGKVISEDDLTWKRPANGISPRDIDSVVGKIAVVDIEEDSAIKKEMIQ